jgi:hypothetical protein
LTGNKDTIPTNNPCVRCGKQRVFARTWEETIVTSAGKSIVVHTLTVCPDEDCQKIVDEKFAALCLKDAELKRNFEKRLADKRVEREKNRADKEKHETTKSRPKVPR